MVVVADRTGADIVAVGPSGAAATDSGRRDDPIRRTAADQWNERHFQNRVENSWQSNAQNVADVVAQHLASGPMKLVMVAGDIRSRNLITDAIGNPPGISIRAVDAGGRAAGSSSEALNDAVHDAVLAHVWRERRGVLAHCARTWAGTSAPWRVSGPSSRRCGCSRSTPWSFGRPVLAPHRVGGSAADGLRRRR